MGGVYHGLPSKLSLGAYLDSGLAWLLVTGFRVVKFSLIDKALYLVEFSL